MNVDWINELIDNYYSFLRKRTSVHNLNDEEWTVISTPFVGQFNDAIELYIKKEGNKILLSDDGITLKNLELDGVNLMASQKRKDILERILLNYGIHINKDELLIEANEKDFPQKKHNLLSALIEINDLYPLAKHTIASLFKEDVAKYLDETEIIYTPQFISKGSTGLEFTFDFQIAYKEKEIVLKAFNNINKMNLPNFLFSWGDIKATREKITNKKITGLAVINNTEKAIKDEYLDALKSKGADVILWTERNKEENRQKLRAVA